jgi:hypothetical protein
MSSSSSASLKSLLRQIASGGGIEEMAALVELNELLLVSGNYERVIGGLRTTHTKTHTL